MTTIECYILEHELYPIYFRFPKTGKHPDFTFEYFYAFKFHSFEYAKATAEEFEIPFRPILSKFTKQK
jgi:hypothetical protein